MGAPAARAAELAYHWAQSGHEVAVLTGFPNHPTGMVPKEWRGRLRRLAYAERTDGVDLFRTWLWPLPNRKAHERMRNYASFCISAGLRGLSLARPDCVIATSPQLLVALSGWWIAFAKRVPFVFEVRDLWPESLAAVGMGTDRSTLHRGLSGLAGFLYRHADHIVVVSPAFKEYLIESRSVPATKISIVENGVETRLFSPCSEEANRALRRQLGVEDNFLVCYAGTLGMAHGLETLLDAAAQLRHVKPDVQFLLVGEGAEKERIKSLAQSRGLDNVSFLDQQPREKIPGLISCADVCVVLLKKTDVFKKVIPTKLLEFMSCARPVILGVDGQARKIVEDAGAGIVIEPENSAGLARAVRQLAADRELGHSLGQRGREHIIRYFSRRQTAENYIRVLEELLGTATTGNAQAAA